MYHALTQDRSLWRAFLPSKVGFIFIVTFLCASLLHSSAQSQDITPPVLLEFTISPVVFDAGQGDITFQWCATARDDLGLLSVVPMSSGGPILQGTQFPAGTLEGEVCGTGTLAQFSAYGTYPLSVFVVDRVGNETRYEPFFVRTCLGGNCSLGETSEPGLCAFATCELINRASLTDTTPPVLTVSATPKTLWPPNGRLVPVTITGTITDAGGGVNASTAAYAVTDEYGLIQPSGYITTLDATTGNYTFTIQLQASRNGNDRNGRQYTIIVSAQDMVGNMGSAATAVIVPQNQGQ